MTYDIFDVLFAVGFGIAAGSLICRVILDILERRKRKNEEKN